MEISTESISLLDDDMVIDQTELDIIPFGEWFHLEIVYTPDSHEIYLNGQMVLSGLPDDPLPAGGISLAYYGEGVGEYDNLIVNALSVIREEATGLPQEEEEQTPEETNQSPEEEPDIHPQGKQAYESEPWVIVGGPPGGIGYDIRMVPENPDIMYVTDSGGGIFKSTDGGMTWVPVNEGIESFRDIGTRVFTVTIDPHNSNMVWIGTQLTGHIYLSSDGGQTWENRSNGIIPSDSGEHSVRGITIDPSNPKVVYAAFEDTVTVDGIGNSYGEVYKSIDTGMNWTRIWRGDNLARDIWIDPRNSQRIFVTTGIFDRIAANADSQFDGISFNNDLNRAGGVGILRSDDGGQTWTVLNEKNGLTGGLYVPSLYMHPENPDTLIAAVSSHGGRGTVPGVYLTEDSGDTWTLIQPAAEETGSGVSMETVEISTSNPDIWYAAASEVIHRSEDGGKTWVHFPMRTSDRPSGYPIDLQVDPRDPYRIFVNSYGGGNMLSTDGGETWVDASQGYTGAGIWGVYVDPENPWSVMVSANTANFHSTDGGKTWKGFVTGQLDDERIGTFRGEIISYPQGSGYHILATGDLNLGYVFHSTDRGRTWEAIEVVDIQELVENEKIESSLYVARALAIAPSDPNFVYLGYSERYCPLGSFIECWKTPPGFYRSKDGGYNWEHMENTPFSDTSILSLAVPLDDPQTVFAATLAGIFRSENGGENWHRLEALESITPLYPEEKFPSIFTVATDPFDASIIYAGSPRGGVFRSEDGGDSWVQTSVGMDPNQSIYDLLPDPNQPGLIYASTRNSGVFYTLDRGNQWFSLNDGIAEMWVDQLALSSDGSVLYAGSHVNGVLRLGTPQGEAPSVPPIAPEEESSPESQPEKSQEEAEKTALNQEERGKPEFNLPCLGGAVPLVLIGLVHLRKWKLKQRNEHCLNSRKQQSQRNFFIETDHTS